MKTLWRALILSSSILSIHAFAIDDTATKVNWSYQGNTGPANWANLSPDFAACANGSNQSPIDVPDNITRATNTLSINYHAAPMLITEDNTTNLMIGKTQTIINDGHTIQLNFPSNTKETMSLNGTTYQLVQFHIHTPSEHTLDNKTYPLEIHFVNQGPNGQLAVIAVFVQTSKTQNPALEKIIDNLPKQKNIVYPIQNTNFNPGSLLPQTHDFYNFVGSLTTPPCTEGVQWIIMPTTIKATKQQITAIEQAIGGNNARPTQPLNNRSVTYSIVGQS